MFISQIFSSGSGLRHLKLSPAGMLYAMSLASTVTSWFRSVGLEVLGWILIPVGIALMPLPGPGLLVVAAGVALLSRRYVWAQRARDS